MATRRKKRVAPRRWEPSPPALVARFDEFVNDLPRVERRKMFGCAAAFVNGKMFAGLLVDRVLFKLPAKARAELAASKSVVPFEPQPGRIMGEFVLARPALMKSDAGLQKWLKTARDYVESLSNVPAKNVKR